MHKIPSPNSTDKPVEAPAVSVAGPDDGVVRVRLTGDWADANSHSTRQLRSTRETLTAGLPDGVSRVRFDADGLIGWDSRVLVFIKSVAKAAKRHALQLDLQGLPAGMTALLQLSDAVNPRRERNAAYRDASVLTAIGRAAIDWAAAVHHLNCFLGRAVLSFWRFLRGEARFLRADVLTFMQEAGPQALPIIGVINMLLGIILGFMGAVQLKQFGAQIYVADLVALGQTREIAPMMTAIVIAGRTGAAYAAQLGTMQVNEEIDALRTFGFSPMDFLVLPRMLALAIMFPVLVLYADAIGMFGGYLVGVTVLDLNTAEYIEQSRQAIDITDISLGLVKGSVFGVLVAVAGCMHGMNSGRSASAVGDATTRAVVTGIIAIIITTAVFSVLTNFLGI